MELAFLELDRELWDREGRRLTVLFDPGRIKRDVLPLVEMGPAIEEGRRYTLAIDRDWPDSEGGELAAEFRKEFAAGPADRTPPDPAQWKIAAPRPGTSDALAVDFPEPMDFALLQHSLAVTGPDGNVEGAVTIDHDETRWQFAPQRAWKAGEYCVVVQKTLEDLAGNRIGRAFDVDTFAPITREAPRDTVSLRFVAGQE